MKDKNIFRNFNFFKLLKFRIGTFYQKAKIQVGLLMKIYYYYSPVLIFKYLHIILNYWFSNTNLKNEIPVKVFF